MTYSVVGKSLPRIDAREKVTGEAKYCVDLKLPGMLYGKIKRSPLPFARILNIDTSKVKKMIGVKAVITAEDTPKIPYGTFIADELSLAKTLVRFVGDGVAAVAAVDEDVAEEALELIEVDYEELTPILDPEQAIQPGAPAVHPELEDIKFNIPYRIDYTRGDPDQGFSEADLILEDRFVTQAVHQAYLEPQVCVSQYDSAGKLTIWGSLQAPFRSRSLIAKALGIPEHYIRMIQPYVGGGFGGKGGATQPLYPISAILAKKSGRSVKIVYTRREEFIAGRPRLSETIDLRLGLRKTGKIMAKDVRILADGGAYAGMAPAVLGVSATRTGSLYRIPNIRMKADLVYTNKIPRSSFRGFGNPQMHFALECLLDEGAVKLNIDPRDLRLMNATQEGDITAHGWVINSCGLSDSIKRTSEDANWDQKRMRNKQNCGVGMACLVHVSSNRGLHPLFDGSSAILTINEHGKVKLISGEGEIGQGATTVFAQIASEELGISIEDIEIVPVDTDISPFGSGAFASRVTTMGGSAVKLAALNLKKELFKARIEQLGVNAEDLAIKNLEIRNGEICIKDSPGKGIPIREVAFKEVFKRGGGHLIGIGNYAVPDWVVVPDKTRYGNISVGYPFGTQIAEVEVDVETGKIKVLGLWAAHDLGRVINPIGAEGQIEGGIVQGIGYALTESYCWEAGRVLNTKFADYKIPMALDIPPINIVLIESNDPNCPYGAKGVGEPTLIATPPAIANAIFNAIGERIRDLPITSEKILKALRTKSHEKGEGDV
jgi:CO/xanthine dehydrogenase Mo-binding subunit